MGEMVTARNGMVASSQKLATEVGLDLLKQGGTAADAAIGVNAMLSLIEPFMCGPGGDLFALVWEPRQRKLSGLNASGRSPKGVDLKGLQRQLGDVSFIPNNGLASITVPGVVAGWEALHEKFGKLPLEAIFAPVIEYGRQGVYIGPNTHEWWREAAAVVTTDNMLGELSRGFKECFLVDGAAPQAGALFKNPALSETYLELAQSGWRCFYEGRLADSLIGSLHSMGSLLSHRDLESCKADWVAPISTDYCGYRVYELPPNGQGLSVLQMLNCLEHYFLSTRRSEPDSEYWHYFIESKKLAFEDRAAFYADPSTMGMSVAALNGKAYAQKRFDLIGERAISDPVAGFPELSNGDTTYLSVADKSGMMVSLIQSIYNGFGSAIVPDEMGFAIQSRGAGFSLDASHPNVYAPSKRPFHTIIPAFVTRNEEPFMSFGVMGADMQPQGQVQILVNIINYGMDVQQAGDAARLRHDGKNAPNRSDVSDKGVVWYEPGFSTFIIDELESRGHDVRPATHPVAHFMGGYQCVQKDSEGWSGASESRFDGCAAGY